MNRKGLMDRLDMPRIRDERFVAFDLETSSLDPAMGGEIIAIAAVELLEPGVAGRVFETRVKPVRPLTRMAEEIVGFSNTDLENAPAFADVVGDFLAFVAEAKLVGINSGFDRAFLNAELVSAGYEPLAPERFFDLAPFIPEAIREAGTDAVRGWVGPVEGYPLSTGVYAGIFRRSEQGTVL